MKGVKPRSFFVRRHCMVWLLDRGVFWPKAIHYKSLNGYLRLTGTENLQYRRNSPLLKVSKQVVHFEGVYRILR